MELSREDLRRAAGAGLISDEQAERLWDFLVEATQAAGRPRFDAVHLLWYAGALIVMAAAGLFTSLAWDRFGCGVLAALAVLYGAVLVVAGRRLWRTPGLRVAGGLLITIAVTMAPLAVFGWQNAVDWWQGEPARTRDYGVFSLRDSGLFMESATILAGVVALRYFRFPLLLVPILGAGWFLVMETAGEAFGRSARLDQAAWVSIGYGLVVLALSWLADIRGRTDFAFWGHLAGLLAFWVALGILALDDQVAPAAFAAVSAGLVALSAFLMRRLYAVFGGLGLAAYLGYLAGEHFAGSLLFPVALALIGLAVIGAGLLFFRARKAMAAWLARALPARLQALRPAHAR